MINLINEDVSLPNPSNRIKTWVLAFSILTICLLIVSVGVGVFIYNDSLVGEVTIPSQIKIGDEFELKLTINNPTNKSVLIPDIIIQPTYDEAGQNHSYIGNGAKAIGSTPKMEIVINDLGSIQFSYFQTIDPGQTKTIILKMKANKQGVFEGAVTIYTYSYTFINIHCCYSFDVKIEIKP